MGQFVRKSAKTPPPLVSLTAPRPHTGADAQANDGLSRLGYTAQARAHLGYWPRPARCVRGRAGNSFPWLGTLRWTIWCTAVSARKRAG
jgi:hypothetical protein